MDMCLQALAPSHTAEVEGGVWVLGMGLNDIWNDSVLIDRFLPRQKMTEGDDGLFAF